MDAGWPLDCVGWFGWHSASLDRSAAFADEICSKLTRNMSRREWRQWISAEDDYICPYSGLPIRPDDAEAKMPLELCPGKPAEPMFRHFSRRDEIKE